MRFIRWAMVLVLARTASGQLPGIDGVPVSPTAAAANVPLTDILCNVQSAPRTVRLEGMTELLGDIEILCQGNLRANPRNNVSGAPAQPVYLDTYDISVTLSVPVTNRTGVTGLTDTFLLIDDPDDPAPSAGAPPNPRRQTPCVGPNGPCASLVAHDGVASFVPGSSIPIPGPVTDGLAGAAAFSFGGQVINVFQGVRAGPNTTNTIHFQGVPISNYDTRANPRLLARYNELTIANAGSYARQPIVVAWQKRFRIKNLRGAVASNASVNSQVVALVTVTPPPPPPPAQVPADSLVADRPRMAVVLGNLSAVIGQPAQGVVFRQLPLTGAGAPLSGFDLATCQAMNPALALDSANPADFAGLFLAGFEEVSPGAFRPRGFVTGQNPQADQSSPTAFYATESGFYNTRFPVAGGWNSAGIADSGTRLRLAFRNLPPNVRLFVSVSGTTASSTTLGAYAVVADASGATPAPITIPVAPTARPASLPAVGPPPAGFAAGVNAAQGIYPVPLISGSGTAFWEVHTSSAALERIHFTVAVAFTAQNIPPAGTIVQMAGTFAPLRTAFFDTGTFLNGITTVRCLPPYTLCPSQIPPGNNPVTLTIRSSTPAFDAATQLRFNGNPLAFTMVDATELRAVAPDSNLPRSSVLVQATGQQATLILDASSSAIPLRICSADPRTASAGAASLPLTLYGYFPPTAGVFPRALVTRMGQYLAEVDVTTPATPGGRTQASAALPASVLLLPGTLSLLEGYFNLQPVNNIRINDAVRLSRLQPPPVLAGRSFNGQLTATGGVPPYRWSLGAGSAYVRLAPVPGALDQQDVIFEPPLSLAGSDTFPANVVVTDGSVPALSDTAAIQFRANALPAFTLRNPDVATGGTHTWEPGKYEFAALAQSIASMGGSVRVLFRTSFTPASGGATPARGTFLVNGERPTVRDVTLNGCNDTCALPLAFRVDGAGQLELTAEVVEVAGQAVTGGPSSRFVFVTTATAPEVRAVFATRQGPNLSVCVEGITGTRRIDAAEFFFRGVPGSGFSAALRVQEAPSYFNQFFDALANGVPVGPSFYYVQNFVVDGSALDSGSVTVRLTNAAGATESQPIPIPTAPRAPRTCSAP